MSRWVLVFGLALAVSALQPSAATAAGPVAVNDYTSTPEDTPVVIDVLANDYDPDGGRVIIDSFTQPRHGYVTRNPDAGSVTYTPSVNYYSGDGADTFSYTISDGFGALATALVSVFVAPVNDPPVAWAGTATVNENTSVDVRFGAFDPDKEGCDLVFIAESQTAHGQLGPEHDPYCSANGDTVLRTYTPDPGYVGPDSIGFVVSDGTVQSQPAVISITVLPAPQPPVPQPISVTATYGSSTEVLLRATDLDTCELSFRVVTPLHGTLSAVTGNPCTAGGGGTPNLDTATVTYVPAAGYVGADSFTYTVSDGYTSASATVSITIPAPRLHVADIDASTRKVPRGWIASAVVRAATEAGLPLAGVTVAGSWSGATGTCTTDATASCSIASGVIPRKTAQATFAVTALTLAPYVYDQAANTDPDGDSNGTSIVVRRP